MRRFEPTKCDAIGKVCFYAHLIGSALVATAIIILHPFVRRPSLSFLTLLIYGYIIIALALINIVMMVNLSLTKLLNRVACSIWFSRVGIKILISIYPLLGILIFKYEDWVWLCPHLAYFFIYLGIFSVIYIFYELGTYFCCERTNPDWIYKVSPQELEAIKNKVRQHRA